MSVRLFLSYARTDDEPFVWQLYEGLKSAGFEVWFDRVSMPSRQLKFDTEIENAIMAQDRLVLIVGPGAVSSAYVTHEWQFAFDKAVKCVNPIVRLNGKDAAGKPIDGYDLIPEDLRGPHAEDFRDEAQFDLHLHNLIRQLSDPLPPIGKLVAVPELPPNYLEQRDRLASLRDMLLADLRKPVVVTGDAGRVGLQGMGGIGKSVLACALARRPEIRRAFPDGVLWVTLGQKPDIVDLQRKLVKAGFDLEPDFTGEHTGKERLRDLLKERAALIVLDDAWQREHAEAFNVIGPRCRLLLTTRDAGLVTALASQEHHYQVHLPTEAEALALLAKAAGNLASKLPDEALPVVRACGRLPLALALCGGMIYGGTLWRDILEALRDHDLKYLSTAYPSEAQHASVWRAIDLSVRALPEELRRRFSELAVFALDTGTSEAAVETLWEHTARLTPRHARKLLRDFSARSLVRLDVESSRLTLHDLVHDFASGLAGDPAALHKTLLDAYRKKCADGWASGPNDGYYLENLCMHLLGGGQTEEAVALLTDLSWVEAKCGAKLVFSLQRDYRDVIESLPESQAELEEEGRLRARIARWTTDLVEYSRRCTDGGRPPLPEIPVSAEPWNDERITDAIDQLVNRPTRLDDLRSFESFVSSESHALMQYGVWPGFVVQQAYNSADLGPVAERAAKIDCEVPRLLLRHRSEFNPIPAEIRILQGHGGWVYSVSMTADGRRAVSAGSEQTPQVWDLETGVCLRTLEGHTDAVMSVSVTPDGRRAITAGCDNTLRVWDLETAACLRTLEGHTAGVLSVSVTPDGRRAVSADDTTLRVWDLETGTCIWTMDEPSKRGNRVSISADGRRAVSARDNGTLRVWDLETGSFLRTLEGESEFFSDVFTDVCLTPDGQRVVSAGRVWDLETGACLCKLRGKSIGVYSVSVTADGRWAVSAGVPASIILWDLETGECLRTLSGHGGLVSCVSVTADGRRAVSASHDQTLRVWDLERGACPRTSAAGHDDQVLSVSVAPDGRRAVSVSNFTLRVWDSETGACIRIVSLRTTNGNHAKCWSVTPGGWRVVSSHIETTPRVWDLETGECLGVLEGHTTLVSGVSVTPDGRRAVSASYDKTLRVWDLETGTCQRTLVGHSAEVQCVSVTPDGRRAVSAGHDRTLRVWDLETGRCVATLEANQHEVKCVSVTPDGRLALSGGWDKTLRLWDLESGSCLRTLEGHSAEVECVSIMSDGRRAVSGSLDRTLRVWDLETGECLALAADNAACTAVIGPAASGVLIAGTAAGFLRIFDLREP